MTQEGLYSYKSRDETVLQYYYYPCTDEGHRPTVVFIHGITAELHHIHQFALKMKGFANVLIPVLRGYALNGRRGELAYFGQYDDDLADLRKHISTFAKGPIYWVGHSMGSGNLLRLLAKGNIEEDPCVFLSPFFHPSLPVYRSFKEQSNEEDKLFEVKMYKTLFIYMLHRFKVTIFHKAKIAIIPDGLKKEDKLKLSFQLLSSRFLSEVRDVTFENHNQVMTIIGDQDEITNGMKLKKWWENKVSAPFWILSNEDHNSIISSDQTIPLLQDWIYSHLD